MAGGGVKAGITYGETDDYGYNIVRGPGPRARPARHDAPPAGHRSRAADLQAPGYEDYRKVLDRNDIDVVTIVTPDHWHTKIAIEAMKAGKDVYCEKPLTLTIDEGKQICKVLKETGRVFQVGTQQRSEMGPAVPDKAVAMIRDGRIGKVKKVTCAIGGSVPRGPLPEPMPPRTQLGNVARPGAAGRLHREALPLRVPLVVRILGRQDDRLGRPPRRHRPVGHRHGRQRADSVEGTAKHPVTFPTGYNRGQRVQRGDRIPASATPERRRDDIRHDTDNGITFEGDQGHDLRQPRRPEGEAGRRPEDNPLPEDAITKLYKRQAAGQPHGELLRVRQERKQPISDVFTHHRAMTTCHLANIAIRLGRKLNWNPETEQIERGERLLQPYSTRGV
jgi:hypothetical protein